MKWFILSICLFSYIAINAQSIVIDDFDGTNLNTTWATTGTTFSINSLNGELQVIYNRDANSGQWDQFNVAFDNLDLMKYQIKFDVRSNVAFQLTVKPVYSDESSDWLQQNITGNNSTTTITFNAEQTSIKTLNKMYIYFDGGTTASKSGTVYIDNIVIIKAAVYSTLNKAIQNAQLLYNNSTEGSLPGQFVAGSKSKYQDAINAAKLVANNSSATQSEINQAITALNDSTYNFEIKANIDPKVAILSFVDDNATLETKNLYYNLKEISKFQFLFGSQDPTGYGVGWTGDNDRSDIKDVCGSYPAVSGWSIAGVADGNTFEGEEYRMSKMFNLNGINTVEWHMNNPYGGDFYWANNPDPTKNVVASLLPGGEYNDFYKAKLDNIAFYARNLKGSKGQSIPIIFRPFHEQNGDWFWWGQPHCTPDEYKQLWQYTVDYLKSKKVNNILYAYSPDRFGTQANYLQCYPGDDYVDILGFDDYWDLRYYEGLNLTAFISQLEILTDLADTKNKVSALTECGYEGVKYNKWFTEVILNPIENNVKAKRVAYVAVWRNANATHFFAPYPGQASAVDFVNFYLDKSTIFINDMPDVYGQVLDLNEPLGIDKIKNESTAKVFPIPATETIEIKSDEDILNIEMIKIDGTKICEKKGVNTTDFKMNIQSIPNGIYLLKINTLQGKTHVKKIIIAK